MRVSSFLQLTIGAILVIAATSVSSQEQSPQIVGEYLCDECHGFLRVEPASSLSAKIWLGVGGGSCGGEVLVKGALVRLGVSVTVARTENRKRCVTSIRFEKDRAFVSDSCISPESEESSTCDMMGEYSIRRPGR
jgi:hypothetical protein